MGWVVRFLFVLVVMAAPAHAQTAQRRVALVIANGAYAHASQLTNPTSDGRIVADALRRAGFETVDTAVDVGVGAFQRALRDFRSKAHGAQVALVYYAGHGIEGSGKNWLVPTDAALQSDLDLPYEAIELDRVLETVGGASLRIVVVDACRNNPFGRSWRSTSRAITRGLAGVDVDDVLVIFAAAPGQTASDGQGGNSPFATALARRLPQSDLAVQLLGGAVRDDVLAATNGAQRPFVSASITGRPFYLVSGGAGVAAPAPATPSFDPRSADLAYWNACCTNASATASDFEGYLAKVSAGEFPGAFADVARRRRATAVSAPAPPPVATAAPAPSGATGTIWDTIVGTWFAEPSSMCSASMVISRVDADYRIHYKTLEMGFGVSLKFTPVTANVIRRSAIGTAEWRLDGDVITQSFTPSRKICVYRRAR